MLNAVNSFAGNLSPVPTDTSDRIASSGSATVTWWDSTTTDGDFHSVSLPTGVEAKAVLIQVVSATTTDYNNDIGFHYSSTGTSSADFSKHVGGVIIAIGIKSVRLVMFEQPQVTE